MPPFGYTAHMRQEELPAKDYSISITVGIKDLTADVYTGISQTLPATERNAAITRRIAELQRAAFTEESAQGMRSQILTLNEGLRYYKFTSLVLRDLRVVYARPKSIGHYGGDEDKFPVPAP
jgi:hypothetical protein